MEKDINGNTIPDIGAFFTEKAEDIQNGGFEFCNSPDWLDIWWPADEYMFIKLCREHKLDVFYQEAGELLHLFLDSQFIDFPTDLLAHKYFITTFGCLERILTSSKPM